MAIDKQIKGKVLKIILLKNKYPKLELESNKGLLYYLEKQLNRKVNL